MYTYPIGKIFHPVLCLEQSMPKYSTAGGLDSGKVGGGDSFVVKAS